MNNTSGTLPQILIAEDDESNYLLIKFLLQRNYNLIHANNGREVLELYNQYHPQLILMDIKMPEIDGYKATAILRQDSITIPIVAVTAYAFAEDVEKILQSGFNAYISKPIDSTKLKILLNQFLK